ncbi:MAG: DUF21 domain-containing protein [Candidatus Krumholzibacteriota bacterium]|nr:DUF21 domain-containing protein [Candidatus Krumholzibacteriota bacterium]
MGAASLIAIVVVSLMAAGFFAGAESAVVSCNKVKLHHRAARGNRRARAVERLLSSSESFFSIVLVGTNIAVVVCTATATALTVRWFGESGAAVATAVMTPLILVFGEVIPKAAFIYQADRVSLLVGPLLRVFQFVLWPIAFPATLLVRALLRLTGAGDDRRDLLASREELVYLYSRGKRDGVVERRERMLIDRVFHFRRVLTGELLVPREKVISFAATATVGETIEDARRHTYSRFPILSPDHRVVGVISLFDLLGLDGGERLGDVMHDPVFVDVDAPAERLLVQMKESAIHLAVVTGSDGNWLGIVTLEDVLEHIIGDIANEYDE